MTEFVHLHNHSEYSLLDGLSKIGDMVAKVKSLGMTALALTDHGNMYGIHEFYVTCKKAGIKPILGCEFYLARKSRFDKDPQKDKKRFHQLVFAKNNVGYKNLMKLMTLANLEGFYYKPRIDWEILEKYHEGLIVTSGCPAGQIPNSIINEDWTEVDKSIKHYLDIFGDDFYLEIQRHENVDICDVVNKGIIELSRKYGIPLIATNDNHYINKEDAQAQDALIAVSTKSLISDTNRMTMLDSETYYLKTGDEMAELFADLPEAIENTVKLAAKCDVDIPLGGRIMPVFPIPDGLEEGEYLKKHTYETAQRRFPKRYEEMKPRLDYELDIIITKGYAAYFLIYEDFVGWSKSHGVRVGPGRGSAAGSLVSYILNITSINPLDHKLPFERFLNPFRPSPPDIDMDFADDRRGDVINYVRGKYGEDKVAQMITFGRMEARAAIRDIGRVMGFPYSDPDKLAKLIPTGSGIDEALKDVPEFAQEYENPAFRKLIDLAKQVEGNIRHASVHAAAVVVAPTPFWDYSPLQKDEKTGRVVTQYDMHGIDCNVSEDALGLLKMDFLGLRTLSILQKALDLVKEQTGKDVNIDDLPLDDEGVYKLLCSGETTGVFQIESAGMRRVAKNLKPNAFSDIAALVALYRPGPMDLIPEFIAGKENPDKIQYPHPDLKQVLGETYGIAVYQEQCLEIAHVIAGYSLGEADILRRAIGKKKIEIMMQEKQKFYAGAKKKGYTEAIAETVWGYIEKFAGYGFNKAHSASYGYIVYQTAWMKVHYPVEYITALMTQESGDAEKITVAIEECKRMGIIINPPDINKSQMDFSIEKNEKSLTGYAIRFGLKAIKNVGEIAIENIIATRDKSGEFKTLTDFFSRVDQKVNKRVVESLIQVGAFDKFGKRSALLAGFEQIRTQAVKSAENKASGQMSFFDVAEENEEEPDTQDDLPDIAELDQKEKLRFEKELLGFYLSDNPFAKEMQIVANVISHRLVELDSSVVGRTVKLGGIFTSLRKVFTKKNNSEMAFGNFTDNTGDLDVVIFPKAFELCKEHLQTDRVFLIEGKLDMREDALSLLADTVSVINTKDLEFLEQQNLVEIEIPKGTPREILTQLNLLLKSNLGRQSAVILFPNGDAEMRKIFVPYKINYNKDLERQIHKLLY